MDQTNVEGAFTSPPKKSPGGKVWMIFTLVAFLSGLGGGYWLWGGRASTGSPLAAAPLEEQIAPVEKPGAEPELIDLVQQVNPPEGYAMPANFGSLGPELLAAGAIDFGKFVSVYQQAGQPLTEAQVAILQRGSDSPVVFNRENAYFLLNFFWALGLTNQNPILTEGPMMQYGPEQIGRFASTGGWTIGSQPSTELYASVPLIPLTPAQQARLERVAENVYRPCCNNPTHFPDCNHGMAMLGMLTLMASQEATEEEMYQAAKYANAFWYPQQSLELAVYFQVAEGQGFADVDAEKLVSAKFSSGAGFRAVHQLLAANGLLKQAPGSGNNCGV